MAGDAVAGISVRGLTHHYRGRAALRDVTFDVPQGSVTGLLGPNGSGKTTVLRILLGLERPARGAALIDGRPLARIRRPFRTVGALLDASWIHPGRSAADHLRWIAQASGLPDERVEQALAEVGLSDVADRPAGTFSLGMRQRLGIASTVLGDPRVLIYDEPLNGLDPAGVQWIREFLLRQAVAGRAVLVSSHLLDEIDRTADALVVLGRGEVVYTGSLDGLTADETPATELEVDDRPGLDRLLEHLGADHGWTLTRGAARAGSLAARVEGATVGEVAAALGEHGVIPRRLEQSQVLERAYRSLTDARVDYATAGPGGTRTATGRRTA